MTTDELIAFYQAQSRLDPDQIATAIPLAIDALYTARDAGASMHDAGAAVAMAVLEEVHHKSAMAAIHEAAFDEDR